MCLSDGFLFAVTLVALVCVIISSITFEGEYLMTDPISKEDIRVQKPLEDPYASTNLKLFIAFGICTLIGLGARKYPLIAVAASVCTIVISLNYYADELVPEWGFVYVLAAVLGLAGNLIFTYFHYKENQ